MDLTEEQLNIIEASKALKSEQKLKIDACAGSGKTSTLVEIAKANPDKKYLYLAFNKAIVEEAKNRFPKNVDVKTTHSLAYGAVIAKQKKKTNIISKLRFYDLEKYFSATPKELITLLFDYDNFLNSDKEDFKKYENKDSLKRLYELQDSGILPMTHSFYLKKYSLGQNNLDKKYDAIFLDEAQDTNPVTFSIFNRNLCAKILVGDTHQNIYNFRGSYNSLKSEKADIVMNLSNSFRTPKKIISQANYFLKHYAYDDNFVSMNSLADHSNEINSVAFLSRTNSALIKYMILNEDDIKKIKLTRTPDSIFKTALNVLNFDKKRFNLLDSEFYFLKKFNDLDEVDDYAKNAKDVELSSAIKLVMAFGSALDYIYEKCATFHLDKNDNAEITLSTIHSSKGLEFDEVTIDSNFINIAKEDYLTYTDFSLEELRELEKNGIAPMSETDFQQELNLYYIALTRAKKKLNDETVNSENYEAFPFRKPQYNLKVDCLF